MSKNLDYRKLKSIKVLDTDYKIDYRVEKDDEYLSDWIGYCDKYLKLIVISDDLKEESQRMGSQWEESYKLMQKKVLRHELTHAFITECGLDGSSSGQWAGNEELIDFLAFNAHKLVKLFETAGAL